MTMLESKNIGLCPDCGEEVRFKKAPFVGQLVTCRRCFYPIGTCPQVARCFKNGR